MIRDKRGRDSNSIFQSIMTCAPNRGSMMKRKNNYFLKSIFLVFIMFLTPLTPFAEYTIDNVSAQGGLSRHIYQFEDGSTEYIALYQNGRTDDGAEVSIPKGAIVSDVSMTLSGASATGWSDSEVTDRDDWMAGTSTMTDTRSDTLTLSPSQNNNSFFAHGLDDVVDNNSDAWFDNGTYSIRQPHTSNSTENLYSQQVLKTSPALMAQSQGAILKHHDWLFLSTWSSKQFSNIVKRLYPNNATVESTIFLDQSSCTLPQQPSSSFYSYYGFRDWTITDDERMFAILSTYRYHYSSSAPTSNHRVLEFDISQDDTWKCLDSYDVSPQYSDYTGIAYDDSRDLVWILHNTQRRIVPYVFDEMATGGYNRVSPIYTYFSSSGSSFECGKTGQQVRGLEVNSSTFFMRCQKGSSSQNKDNLEAWKITGDSETLTPISKTKQINVLGYGLQFDGNRFITVDCGYSSFSSTTLNYREYGTGWEYRTIPAPGTTTWFGETIYTQEPVLSANMETYWSASSIGDRVDYWISADNGTHWQQVDSESTIHFAHPGNKLVWKAQLIGSTAVSWWVDLNYYYSYVSSGTWLSEYLITGTKVGKVRPEWSSTIPQGTAIDVRVSNDNGSNWLSAQNNQEINFPVESSGDILRFEISMSSLSLYSTPYLDSFKLWYEEGYPDRPSININGVGNWDWESLQFLNESSIQVSDSSQVGTEVVNNPTLVSSLNQEISRNGEGDEIVYFSVKAESSGRVKITDLDIEYKMQTRAISVDLDGGLAVPDGISRMLSVKVAPGDDVIRVTKTIVELINTNGDNPRFMWQLGDSCSSSTNNNSIAWFDTSNCTSSIGIDGIVDIMIPLQVFWQWDDEVSTQALVSVEDDTGSSVSSWKTDSMDLQIENDIQLTGMTVFDEFGNILSNFEWLRGGTNVSFTGLISFEGSQLVPLPGQFMIRVIGQNVSNNGGNIGSPIILFEEQNPAYGQYNMTFQTPMESEPGGMVFYVQAVNLTTGSNYVNQGFNNIKLILDGNSPLVISSTPKDGIHLHASLPAPSGQPISIMIQDSVDPPTLVTLHYWLGCRTTLSVECNDYNFDNLPNSDEYQTKTLSSPELKLGGINIFQGLIDDSVLTHGQKVSFYVSGQDNKENQIAMGGSPVCPTSNQACGDAPGEVIPNWDADLSTYIIRQEFEPQLDSSNSSIIGHTDGEPLHPGVSYIAQIALSDGNGWRDIDKVQVAFGNSLSNSETSVYVSLVENSEGMPQVSVESGSEFIAVSNLYSTVEIINLKQTQILIGIKFQFTWSFPESYDTDGESFFLPHVSVSDAPCSIEVEVPCFVESAILSSNAWSLDNDFRFDMMPGHLTAIELRDGINHYNSEFEETSIGVGQAIRVGGRVLFSEDETPAPSGIFDIVLVDYDHSWKTSIHEDGEFSMDLLVPNSPSGHLDFSLRMDDMPGISLDETTVGPRLRLAVDSESPQLNLIELNYVPGGGFVSIANSDGLNVIIDSSDNFGFSETSSLVVHYRIRAGESEISRGSKIFSSFLQYEESYFWTDTIDLTDAGATTLLPTYELDIWVSGSDFAGNSFEISSNSLESPFATWSFALVGPVVHLSDPQTVIRWSNPSPGVSDNVNLNIDTINQGSQGNITFILEHYDESGNWIHESNISLEVNPDSQMSLSLPYTVLEDGASTLEFRVLVYLDGVEMDRKTVDPLLIKEPVMRDGQALAQQAGSEIFSISLFIIALFSVSFGMWMLVVSRRIKNESDDFDESHDQTHEVVELDLQVKQLPSINQQQVPIIVQPNLPIQTTITQPLAVPIAPVAQQPSVQQINLQNNALLQTQTSTPVPNNSNIAPLPPTGLPQGWTMEQWSHYGWKYIETLRK